MTTTQPRTMTWSSIRTRYVGPTNYRPARIIVTEEREGHDDKPRRLVVNWESGTMRDTDNYAAAAQAWLDHWIAPHYTECKPVLKTDGYCFGGDYFWSWDMVSVDQ